MGTLSDSLGAKFIVSCGMIFSAACTAMMGAVDLLPFFLALQRMNGIAQSCGWSGLVKIMACWFDQRQRGVVMAWWSTNYAAGGFAATIIATYLATGPLLPELGWKRGALGPAMLLLLITMAFVVLLQDKPRAAQKQAAQIPSIAWSEVVRSRPIWVISISYFCLKLMRYAFLFWLPLYMVEKLRYGPAEAGYTSSIFELTGFTGVLIAGYASDRWTGGKRFPVGATMMVGLAIACLLFPFLSGFSKWGNLAAIGLLGILTFGPDTLMGGAATQDASTEDTAATAAGFVNGVGTIGQLISPIVVAYTVKLYGWDALFFLFVLISLVGAASLVTQWNVTARHQPQVETVNA